MGESNGQFWKTIPKLEELFTEGEKKSNKKLGQMKL